MERISLLLNINNKTKQTKSVFKSYYHDMQSYVNPVQLDKPQSFSSFLQQLALG